MTLILGLLRSPNNHDVIFSGNIQASFTLHIYLCAFARSSPVKRCIQHCVVLAIAAIGFATQLTAFARWRDRPLSTKF